MPRGTERALLTIGIVIDDVDTGNTRLLIDGKMVVRDPSTVFDFENGKFRWEKTEIDPVALQANEDFYQKELSKHRYYKVRRGDCLGKIARKYGISIRRLKQLNGLKSNMIRPGQVLRCS